MYLVLNRDIFTNCLIGMVILQLVTAFVTILDDKMTVSLTLYFHAPLPELLIAGLYSIPDCGHWCSLSFEHELFVRAPIGRR